jgi:ketosteroid isomerase-like protein
MAAKNRGDMLDTTYIQDVLNRYLYAADSHDLDALDLCFRADAEMRVVCKPDGSGGYRHVGLNAIRRLVGSTSQASSSCHLLGNSEIVVDRGSGSAVSHVLALLHFDDRSSVVIRGLRYRDRFVRESGKWLIVARAHSLLWEASVPAESAGIPGAMEAILHPTLDS